MVELVRHQVRHRSGTVNSTAGTPAMAKHYQQTDYFVPNLAPYVQWVHAYKELISSLYEQHKTVGRTWKAFKEAVPGVEQRLEFAVFEQILLFSLFLSECGEISEPARDSRVDRENSKDRGPDAVIRELRDACAERDKALWNLKHLEENVARLTVQKEDLEGQVKQIEIRFRELRDEFDSANENLERVIHELDTQKAENAGLRVEAASSREKRTSLEERIQKLLKKSTSPPAAKGQTTRPAAVGGSKVNHELSQMVIQWVAQDGCESAGAQVIQNPRTGTASKKIGGWNAQCSKDGYYRLYRKIMGRVHSIYIGKKLDIDKARIRIAEKERKLLDLDSASGPQMPDR